MLYTIGHSGYVLATGRGRYFRSDLWVFQEAMYPACMQPQMFHMTVDRTSKEYQQTWQFREAALVEWCFKALGYLPETIQTHYYEWTDPNIRNYDDKRAFEISFKNDEDRARFVEEWVENELAHQTPIWAS